MTAMSASSAPLTKEGLAEQARYVLQALAASSIDAGRTLNPVPGPALALAALLAAALAGTYMMRASWRAGLLATVAGAVGWCALTLVLQRSTAWFADISPVVVTLSACYGVSLVRRIDHQHVNLLAQRIRVATQSSQKHFCTADRRAVPHTLTCVRHPTGKAGEKDEKKGR